MLKTLILLLSVGTLVIAQVMFSVTVVELPVERINSLKQAQDDWADAERKYQAAAEKWERLRHETLVKAFEEKYKKKFDVAKTDHLDELRQWEISSDCKYLINTPRFNFGYFASQWYPTLNIAEDEEKKRH